MARTAKKKLPIYDQGVLITDDADSLNFSGSGQSTSISGNDVTENIPGGGGLTLLPATGAINGSNAAFTFTVEPTYIVSDGAWYTVGVGWTWNSGTLTATMTIPPNNSIWGFE